MSLSLLDYKMWALKIVQYKYALIRWKNLSTFTKLILRTMLALAPFLIFLLPNVTVFFKAQLRHSNKLH